MNDEPAYSVHFFEQILLGIFGVVVLLVVGAIVIHFIGKVLEKLADIEKKRKRNK